MNFIKKVGKDLKAGADLIGSGIEIDSLKKQRAELDEEFKVIEKKHENWLKHADERIVIADHLTKSNEAKLIFQSKANLVTKEEEEIKAVYEKVIAGLTHCMTTLQESLATLNEQSDVDDVRFDVENRKYLEKREKINAKLTDLRDKRSK